MYRKPRLLTGFPVEFVVAGATLHGLCRDISDTGIRAECDDPLVVAGTLAVGGSGLLILRPLAGVLELQAQVTYVETRQIGLLFVFATPWERTMTVAFIAAIADDEAQSPMIRI